MGFRKWLHHFDKIKLYNFPYLVRMKCFATLRKFVLTLIWHRLQNGFLFAYFWGHVQLIHTLLTFVYLILIIRSMIQIQTHDIVEIISPLYSHIFLPTPNIIWTCKHFMPEVLKFKTLSSINKKRYLLLD